MYIHGPHLTHGVQPSMLPVLQNQDDTTSHVYTWSPSDAWCTTINVTSSTKSGWHNFTCIYMVPIWRMVYNHQCYQFYKIRMTQLHMYIHGPHLTHGVQPSMLPVLQNQDETTSHVYTWSPSDAWCITINVTSSTRSGWHNFTCIYMVPIWCMVYNHQCYQFYKIRMT